VNDSLARTGGLAVDNSDELPTAPAFIHNSTASHHHGPFLRNRRYKATRPDTVNVAVYFGRGKGSSSLHFDRLETPAGDAAAP
jgi:hypothetical protein